MAEISVTKCQENTIFFPAEPAVLFPLLAGTSLAAVLSPAGAGGHRQPRRGSPGARRDPRPGGAASGRPRHGAGLCPAADGVCFGAEVRGCPRSPARSRFPEVPGLSHPSVEKALAAAEPPRLRLPACSPRDAAAWERGRRAGKRCPLYPRTSRSLCSDGGGCRASCPAARGLQAGQPPRPGPSPRFNRAHPYAAPRRQAAVCSPSPLRGRRGRAPKDPLLSLLSLFHIWYLRDG